MLVKLEPGADIETVRDDLRDKLPESEVLTKAEFRDRSLNHWLLRPAPAWR